MEKNNGTRHSGRVPIKAQVRLAWHDEHDINRYAQGRCLNISMTGLRMEVSDTIPVGTYVSFRIESLRFGGSASVRNVNRRGVRQSIGLEFSGGLRWMSGEEAAECAPQPRWT